VNENNYFEHIFFTQTFPEREMANVKEHPNFEARAFSGNRESAIGNKARISRPRDRKT
jgi:hypothetical protein